MGLTPDEVRQQLSQDRLGQQRPVTRPVYLDYDVDEEGRITSIKAAGHEMLINFVGPPERTFAYVPFYQVAESAERARAMCAGKIVMVGATTRLAHDDWPTPFSPWSEPSRMAGVEVQANAVQTLHDGLFIRWSERSWVEGLLFGTCIAMAFLTLWLRPVRALALVVVMAAGLGYLELHLFAQQRLWLPVVTSILGGTATFLGVTTAVYFTEEREKRHLRSMFRRYVGPGVMHEIVDRHAVEVSGELRTVTMVFTDLHGFTTLAQDLSPQAVVALLRPYLTRMTQIIFAYQGTLDKFMGDGIMAYFGAPVAFDDHAEKAVLAAIEMQAQLGQMRDRGELAVPLYMRIGVHTGEAVVGDVGSAALSSYTVIGDPVNVSARLEELNKKHGSEILISYETYERVKGLVEAVYLGEEVVRGRDEPTGVYRVEGLRKGVDTARYRAP
jgi:adenylate cyclase